MHRAIKGNHTRVVAILVEAGANVEYADQDGHTPLFCSLKWSVPSEITDILILVGNASLKDVHFFPPEVQLRLEQRGFYRPTFERDFKKSKVSLKAHCDALMAYIETLCIPRVLAVIIVDYHRCVDIRRHFFIEAREQGWKDDLLLVR